MWDGKEGMCFKLHFSGRIVSLVIDEAGEFMITSSLQLFYIYKVCSKNSHFQKLISFKILAVRPNVTPVQNK